ncbi:MAG: HIT domain-containing protein [Candidatus Pacearchaeota archaeon]|nr:HIT domain-containing protein [Candidatus Pacearchaeota archaeon]
MLTEEQAEELKKKLLKQLESMEETEQVKALKEEIENMNKEELEEFIQAQMAMAKGSITGGTKVSQCIFCQLIEGKLETVKIYEDREIAAFLDIYPASLGHMLIMPKEHYETIEEIPDTLLSKVFLFVKAITPSFLKITKAKGFNIFVAQGEEAGQRVKHFYLNLIPRYDKDNIDLTWSQFKVDKKELEALGEKLRKEAEKEIRSKIAVAKEKEERKRKKEEESEAEKIMKHIKRRMP